jgi:hypothetical protein
LAAKHYFAPFFGFNTILFANCIAKRFFNTLKIK